MNDRTTTPCLNLDALLEKSMITPVSRGGNGNPEICDIVYDSRLVTAGALYVAIPGIKVHGDKFIKSALEKGAVAVISENPHPELTVPWTQVQGAREKLGILAAALWKVNEHECAMAAITGTNGKTTVAHLYEALFAVTYPQRRVWMFGTIDYHIDGKTADASHTTPESLDIFRYMGTAVQKPEAVVMEVSSHSLALDRVGGMSYDIAVFTNLTQDHLDYHKTMEQYFEAKLRLFTRYLKPDGYAVVNIDDDYGRRIATVTSRCMTYGRAEDADCRITAWKCTWEGCELTIYKNGVYANFTSTMRGFFNIYNMAALVAGAMARGYTTEQIQQAFNHVPVVSGRMERIIPEAPFAVVVDYAHTPDALRNVLFTARELTRGRLFCVFGCGGDRDRTKRPLMGAAVAALCDEAWVTSDNPRSEKPMDIINEIIEGIPLDFPHQIVAERTEAITLAMRAAQPGDCIVIAGKGHETYQEIMGVKHHFDDKEAAAAAYASLRKDW